MSMHAQTQVYFHFFPHRLVLFENWSYNIFNNYTPNLAWLRQTSYFRSISVRFCTQSDIANQLLDYLWLRTSRPTNEQRVGWEPWHRR